MKGLALITAVLLLCLCTEPRPRSLWLERDIAVAGQQQSLAEPTVEKGNSKERATICNVDFIHIASTVSELLKPSVARSPSNIRRDTIVSSSGATVIENGGSPGDSGSLSQSEKIAIGIGVPTGMATIIVVLLSWRAWKTNKKKQALEQNGSQSSSQHYNSSYINSQRNIGSYASSTTLLQHQFCQKSAVQLDIIPLNTDGTGIEFMN